MVIVNFVYFSITYMIDFSFPLKLKRNECWRGWGGGLWSLKCLRERKSFFCTSNDLFIYVRMSNKFQSMFLSPGGCNGIVRFALLLPSSGIKIYILTNYLWFWEVYRINFILKGYCFLVILCT